jgi:hypothetical protein
MRNRTTILWNCRGGCLVRFHGRETRPERIRFMLGDIDVTVRSQTNPPSPLAAVLYLLTERLRQRRFPPNKKATHRTGGNLPFDASRHRQDRRSQMGSIDELRRRSTHPALRAPLRWRSLSLRRGGDFVQQCYGYSSEEGILSNSPSICSC